MWWRRNLVALSLAAAGCTCLAAGGWVHAKAVLAQVLLERAWASSRAAGGSPVKAWSWADTWPVARLKAPRLGVDEIVLAGARGATLAFGPGHVAGTARPGDGGNVALAGHRDTHFRFLQDLAPGDTLELEAADGGTSRYVVEEARVVDHRDLEPLAPTPEPRLTLVTCYPFDAVLSGGPWRYVVTATGQPGSSSVSAPSSSALSSSRSTGRLGRVELN